MDALAGWSEFNVAMAGATAALAGLVIVAASVNISRIIEAPSLTGRLGAAISVLVVALAVAGAALVPGMTGGVYGAIVIAGAIVAGVFQTEATRRIFENRDPASRAKILKSVVGFLPIAAYLFGGILLLVGSPAGMYVIAAACILAMASGLLVSWVVLVEVLR